MLQPSEQFPVPELSVIVVVLTRRADCLNRCLVSLTTQQDVSMPELIVPCDETCTELVKLREQYPVVRFLPVSGTRTYAELRSLGIHESRGRIVALTEDHCKPAPDWCKQILTAHERSDAAIGGAVDKEPGDSALNWAFYLADYARYMNPVAEGPTKNLTDCNVSYKRSALEAIADRWREEFHEPTVHSSLVSNGESLRLSPRIVVYQQRSLRFVDAMRDRYAFGRLFSATRSEVFSSGKRAFYAALSFLLPALLVTRVMAHVFRTKRYTKEFFIALPYLTLISIVWASGEFLGYVTGQAETSLTPAAERSNPEPHNGQEALI